jgi:hypothetical protein
MPTPESEAAFARVVAARAKLSQINDELRTVETEIRQSAAYSEKRISAEAQYDQLQVEWDNASRDLKSAVDEFSATLETSLM